jgi:vanillate O-demethylase ferredoxin subunit
MERSDSSHLRLSAMRYGAEDILLYEFEALGGLPLAAAEAGAHLDVTLPGGLIRQYSLLTPLCDAQRYVVGVKREEGGRGGSKWLHDSARVGQMFEVGAPRNHFALAQGDAPVVLLAGGIGITPIYSMLAALRAQGRAVHLHYWCRSPAHALFVQTLEGCSDVTLHYSRAPGVSRTSLSEVVAVLAQDAQVYCCGPQGMLDTLDSVAASLGPRLHLERFHAAVPTATAEQAFTVVLARSGTEVAVAPGETILQTLLAAGVDVMYSCEQGICGACEVKVIDGEPVHCDSVRTGVEHARHGTMMICCSSSASARLVLDI